MIIAILLQAAAPAPVTTSPPLTTPSMPPQDWSTLPDFPLPRAARETDGVAFVRGEVDSGRCKAQPPQPDGVRMVAPLAILIDAVGGVTRIVPRAIGCATVEQFTAGYIQSLTRGWPDSATPPAAGWYRLNVSYRW